MTLDQKDDMAEGIARFETAIAALEREDSDANRVAVHAEGRGLLATFEDESFWRMQLHSSHARLKELFTQAEPLMQRTPNDLSGQFTGYAIEIRNFSDETLRLLKERFA